MKLNIQKLNLYNKKFMNKKSKLKIKILNYKKLLILMKINKIRLII